MIYNWYPFPPCAKHALHTLFPIKINSTYTSKGKALTSFYQFLLWEYIFPPSVKAPFHLLEGVMHSTKMNHPP